MPPYGQDTIEQSSEKFSNFLAPAQFQCLSFGYLLGAAQIVES
jgi:hypothetical protein